MYSIAYQELLKNGEYRTKINCSWLYTCFDVRSKIKYDLNTILEKIENKYGTELCFLNSQYIKEVD